MEKTEILQKELENREIERKNFKFENSNHIIVKNDSVTYVMTGDTVIVENGNLIDAMEELRIIVAEKLVK